MEKTVLIDGRQATFKATGGIGYRYKAQFGREFLVDIQTLQEFMDSAEEKQKKVKGPDGKITFQKYTDYDYTKLSLESMYNILWTMAKTADESIPDPQAWLDSFDTFPVMDIWNQVQGIFTANLKTQAKNA